MTKREYEEWRRDPTTQEVFKHFKEMREGLVNSLVNGNTLKEGSDTGEATAKVVGILYGIDLLLEMEFEEEEENESK